jgi:PilZ domain
MNKRWHLGMRVAPLAMHYWMPSMKVNCVMEETLPMLSVPDRHEERKNQRRYVRKMVTLRMIAADKAGLVTGQVIDVTTRGARLRLTRPLTPRQYLTLKVYLNNGTGSVLCELVQVQWVDKDRAGVAFLRMSLENESRLHQLCGDQPASELWD